MTKFELPEKPKKTNTSEDFNNLRKAVDELDKFDYAWKAYANKADRRINAANKHIEELERENQRLIAENLGVKTLVDNAKPQQPLPEVPECVAEGIESIPRYYSAFGAMLLVKNKFEKRPEDNEDWMYLYNWLFDLENEKNNQDLFVRAWLDGYTVQKPQLFYLKNKLTGSLLIHINSGYKGDYCEMPENVLSNKESAYFTQQEIDSMQTGSYEKIEVAE